MAGYNLAETVPEPMIEAVVHTFYDRIREDEVLGPIFDATIDDWDPHLATMVDFWSSIMNTTGRYRGSPPMKHAAVSAIQPEHFVRWVALFGETVDEICPPSIAASFRLRSERMAVVLTRKISEIRSY